MVHTLYPHSTATKGIWDISGAPANGKEWPHTWVAQILLACAWVQVSLFSGCTKADAMRAMHSVTHCAHADSPHYVQGTVHHLSYGMPADKCVVVGN